MVKRSNNQWPLIFNLLLLTTLVFPRGSYAENGDAPEHFINPPENINPDPNYVPGDYALPDLTQALSFFATARRRLDAMEIQKGDKLFRLKKTGEIRVTVTKNQTIPVLAYFHDFDGYILFRQGVFSETKLIISLNSWDTAVPGRDNRVRALLFESMLPEKAIATLHLTHIGSDLIELDKLQDQSPLTVEVSGVLAIGGIVKPVRAMIEIDWGHGKWKVKQAKPLEILISDFGFGEKALTLMEACNHKSIANKISIEWELEFKKE